MKKTTTNPETYKKPEDMTAAELLTAAHVITHQICHNRYKLTAQAIMLELDNANRYDITRDKLPELVEQESACRRIHDEMMEQAHTAEQLAKRVTLPKPEREAAAAAALRYKAAAEAARKDADALWDIITNGSHSAAADITQAAALALVATGDWKQAQRAAGKESNALRKVSGLSGSRTAVYPISEEEYNSHRSKTTITAADGSTRTEYGEPIPEKVKTRKGRENGYITFEERHSAHYDGYFAVWHRPAERAVIVYDSMDGESETARTYADNGGLNAVQDAWDAEAIQQMLTAANLTEQERRIVQKAAAIIMQTDAHTAHQYAAAWAKALRLCNVYAAADQTATQTAIETKLSNTEKSRIKRIKDKLSAAKAAQERQQAAEEVAAAAAHTKPLDLVAAMSRHAATIPTAAPVIRWTRRPYAQDVQDVTAEYAAAAAARQAAQAETERKRIAAAMEEAAAEHEKKRLEDVADGKWWLRKPEEETAEARQHMATINAWLKRQDEHKAAAAAAEEQRKAANARKLAAYNATLKATFAAMGTTYAAATEEQRSSAKAAAQAAYDAAE